MHMFCLLRAVQSMELALWTPPAPALPLESFEVWFLLCGCAVWTALTLPPAALWSTYRAARWAPRLVTWLARAVLWAMWCCRRARAARNDGPPEHQGEELPPRHPRERPHLEPREEHSRHRGPRLRAGQSQNTRDPQASKTPACSRVSRVRGDAPLQVRATQPAQDGGPEGRAAVASLPLSRLMGRAQAIQGNELQSTWPHGTL